MAMESLIDLVQKHKVNQGVLFPRIIMGGNGAVGFFPYLDDSYVEWDEQTDYGLASIILGWVFCRTPEMAVAAWRKNYSADYDISDFKAWACRAHRAAWSD